jgi:hypothetical protein
MSVKNPITGAKYVEYIAEDRNVDGTWGVTPTTPTFKWLGLVEEFVPPFKELYENKRYLGASGETHALELQRNINVGTELTASLKYMMQDWDLIEFIAGATTGFSDTVDSISVVSYIDSKWTVLTGGMLTKWAMSVPESGIATVDVDLLFGDIRNLDPSSNDPSANGHADELATAPFVWKDITALKMDANDTPTTSFVDIIGDFGMTITNDVEMPKGIDSTYDTKGAGVAINKRDIEISFEIMYTSTHLTTFRDLVANHTKQNLTFTLGGEVVTVKGLLFDEWIAELKPAELVGQRVTAITDLPSLTIAAV